MEFKIGDKVRVNANVLRQAGLNKSLLYEAIGYIGTVIKVGGNIIAVDFTGFDKGCNLNGELDFGLRSGLFVQRQYLSHIRSQKANIQEKILILINSKKKEVTCTYFDMYGNKQIAVANCSPTDLFNPLIGAQIALMRLAKNLTYPLVVDKSFPLQSMLLETI